MKKLFLLFLGILVLTSMQGQTKVTLTDAYNSNSTGSDSYAVDNNTNTAWVPRVSGNSEEYTIFNLSQVKYIDYIEVLYTFVRTSGPGDIRFRVDINSNQYGGGNYEFLTEVVVLPINTQTLLKIPVSATIGCIKFTITPLYDAISVFEISAYTTNIISSPTVYSSTGIFSSNENTDLQLQTNGTARLQIDKSTGNVGIGTVPNATDKLVVNGNLSCGTFTSGNFSSAVNISGSNPLKFSTYGGGFYMSDATWIRTYNGKSFYQNSGIMRTDGTFQVGGPNGGERFIVNSSGNVGIGILAPGAKLSLGTSLANIKLALWDNGDVNSMYGFGIQASQFRVQMASGAKFSLYSGTSEIFNIKSTGTVNVKELVVAATIPPDYVFEKEYKLRSLSEVESYINANKHLPDVPSAANFKDEGYNVALMQEMLLKKVEELTLYTIELNKQIEALKQELDKSKK